MPFCASELLKENAQGLWYVLFLPALQEKDCLSIIVPDAEAVQDHKAGCSRFEDRENDAPESIKSCAAIHFSRLVQFPGKRSDKGCIDKYSGRHRKRGTDKNHSPQCIDCFDFSHQRIEGNGIDNTGNHHAADQQGEDKLIVCCIIPGDRVSGHSAQNDGQSESSKGYNAGIDHCQTDSAPLPCRRVVAPVKGRNEDIPLIINPGRRIERKNQQDIKGNDAHQTDQDDHHYPERSKHFVLLSHHASLFSFVRYSEIRTGIRIIKNRIMATAVEYPVRLP